MGDGTERSFYPTGRRADSEIGNEKEKAGQGCKLCFPVCTGKQLCFPVCPSKSTSQVQGKRDTPKKPRLVTLFPRGLQLFQRCLGHIVSAVPSAIKMMVELRQHRWLVMYRQGCVRYRVRYGGISVYYWRPITCRVLAGELTGIDHGRLTYNMAARWRSISHGSLEGL